jgi:hypothetical protein
MHTDPPDFMALVMIFIATLTSTEMAHQVGPWATIFILSSAGAGYSLSESTIDRTRLEAAGYVAFRIALAFFFSITIARWVQHYIEFATPIYTVVPIAFCIGAIDTLIRIGKPYWGRLVDKFLPEQKS